MPPTKAKDDAKGAHQLLQQADKLLAEVDGSYILQNKTPREYPSYDLSEVKVGKLLGVGGFGIVYEVKKLELRRDDADSSTDDCEQSNDTPKTSSRSVQRENSDKVHDSLSGAPASTSPSAEQLERDEMNRELATSLAEMQHEKHYAVADARELMAKNVLRNGESRYAIKRLDLPKLDKLQRARGMIDMAIEASYLSVLWHPNIGTYLLRVVPPGNIYISSLIV